jgi:glutamyl/glutaminyl-tRNA synthetase
LATLETRGLAYPCRCSRRDIAAIVGDVPHVELRYPGTCRTAAVPATDTLARRVHMADGTEPFEDLRLGPAEQRPAAQCGDVLVRDRHGSWTYQFAVVVDDLAQDIDLIIRGEDLLASTGRQRRLAALLGGAPPPVLHHPLVRRPDGEKLSKSSGDTGLRELRADGWTPARVLGHAAHLAGLRDTSAPLAAADLAALWS